MHRLVRFLFGLSVGLALLWLMSEVGLYSSDRYEDFWILAIALGIVAFALERFLTRKDNDKN